jgi:C_GCAxxG_C_C family probable redox protein
MPTPSETAAATFALGFNCAQSVLAAYAARLGLDESTALKLASPFGGGIARRGQVCGAVSGALLALGLARGNDQPAGKLATYQLSGEFLQRFEAAHGSLLCRDLLQCDISTPEGHQQAADRKLFATVCPALVRDATELLESFLNPA